MISSSRQIMLALLVLIGSLTVVAAADIMDAFESRTFTNSAVIIMLLREQCLRLWQQGGVAALPSYCYTVIG